MLIRALSRLLKKTSPSTYLKHWCDKELEYLDGVYSDEETLGMEAREKKSEALLANAKRYHKAGLSVVKNTEQIRFERRYFDVAAQQTIEATNRAIDAAKVHGFTSPEAKKLMQELL